MLARPVSSLPWAHTRPTQHKQSARSLLGAVYTVISMLEGPYLRPKSALLAQQIRSALPVSHS